VPRGHMRLPKGFNGRDPQQRRNLAMQLRERVKDMPHDRELARDRQTNDPLEREIAELRAKLKAHPCHECPDREDHARWAERAFKLGRDTDGLRRRVEARTNTVAREFDRVCDVLTALGYLEGDAVTDRGRRLMRLYSELDLLAAESLRAGIWDGLNHAELAGALSALVFEARKADEAAPRIPGGKAGDALREMAKLSNELKTLEREYRLDFLRMPDPGFAFAAYRWADGDDLDEVLGIVDMAAGDFVRNMKQLIDLCGQVADAAGDSPVRTTARGLIDKLKRGIVAYSTLD
jgi:ATP-dependent RNA helicase HelY